jgi:hypothetical protein
MRACVHAHMDMYMHVQANKMPASLQTCKHYSGRRSGGWRGGTGGLVACKIHKFEEIKIIEVIGFSTG